MSQQCFSAAPRRGATTPSHGYTASLLYTGCIASVVHCAPQTQTMSEARSVSSIGLFSYGKLESKDETEEVTLGGRYLE